MLILLFKTFFCISNYNSINAETIFDGTPTTFAKPCIYRRRKDKSPVQSREINYCLFAEALGQMPAIQSRTSEHLFI